MEYCKLAIVETKERARELIEHLERRVGDVAGSLRINLNGCPNACAQYQVADIGLQGGIARLADGAPRAGLHPPHRRPPGRGRRVRAAGGVEGDPGRRRPLRRRADRARLRGRAAARTAPSPPGRRSSPTGASRRSPASPSGGSRSRRPPERGVSSRRPPSRRRRGAMPRPAGRAVARPRVRADRARAPPQLWLQVSAAGAPEELRVAGVGGNSAARSRARSSCTCALANMSKGRTPRPESSRGFAVAAPRGAVYHAASSVRTRRGDPRRRIQRGGGTGPVKPRQPSRPPGKVPNPAGSADPGRCEPAAPDGAGPNVGDRP